MTWMVPNVINIGISSVTSALYGSTFRNLEVVSGIYITTYSTRKIRKCMQPHSSNVISSYLTNK